MTKYNLILAVILSISITSCGQNQNSNQTKGYSIDPSIKSKIDKKVRSENGVAMGSIDAKIYEDDSLTVDTYLRDKSLQCMTFSTLDSDTINITGFMGMFTGFGFQIALFKDTCIVRHFAKSDVEIYKLSKSDSLNFGVSVPCKTYKLTLLNKPTFKKGNVIEGIIELTSDEYYEVANAKESKSKVILTGYFRTEPLQSLEDQ